jgi:hypothetical protein
VQAVPDVWLSIPQAVFLLSTGDLERARGFPEGSPDFLVFLVARTLASKPVFVPLGPLAEAKQRVEVWEAIRQKLAAEAPDAEIYRLGLKALRQILADGVARGKGSRRLAGSFELIDPVEFTRVDLAMVHAIHVVTKEIVWYNVRVSGHDLLELRQLVQSSSAANLGDLSLTDSEPDRPTRSGGWQHPKWRGARNAAMAWLIDYGCPESGDGNQAELERHIASWLETRGHDAGESSIRRHVAGWIKERREELGLKISEGLSGSIEPLEPSDPT